MNKQLSPEAKQGIVLGLFVGLILSVISSALNIPNLYTQLLLTLFIAIIRMLLS
jgi:uncharacterized transporter YbjL